MILSSVYYDPFLAAAAAQAQQDPNYRLQVCSTIFVRFLLFWGARCATNKCKFYTHFHISYMKIIHNILYTHIYQSILTINV